MSIGAKDWSRAAIGWFCNLCSSYSVEGDPFEHAVTETMYQVPAGKILYLTGCCLSISNNSAAVSYGELKVTDGSDTAKYDLITMNCAATSSQFPARSFPLPIKLPSEYKINIVSGDADILVTGFINGFLI